MQTVLHALEDHLLRSSVQCAIVLGLSFSHYCSLKSGARPVPRYLRYHVEALMAMPESALIPLIRQRLASAKGRL